MKILDTAYGFLSDFPPIWMMRQAGRYLPKYKAIRKENPDFISMCINKKAVNEVTLEPIELFDFDAAIIFSDILTIPYAFSQSVSFDAGHGPSLGPLPNIDIDFSRESIKNVYESIIETRSNLDKSKALIGFSGSMWTLLSYMIERGSSKTYEKTKEFVYTNKLFKLWSNKLTDAITEHLCEQIKSGANMVMLFDSWAGFIPHDLMDECCIEPHVKIVSAIKSMYPDTPIVCFPRNLPLPHLLRFQRLVNPHVLALSNNHSPIEFAENIPQNQVLQIGPDPVVLRIGGDLLRRSVYEIKKAMKGRPYIMNLSHGVLKDTSINNVFDFISMTRS
jgi:uroporphyrinogen decarboxylase